MNGNRVACTISLQFIQVAVNALKLFSYFKSGILNVSMFSNVRTSNNLTFGKGHHACECVCGCECYQPEDTEHLESISKS